MANKKGAEKLDGSLSLKMKKLDNADLDEIASEIGTTRSSLIRMLVIQQLDAYRRSGRNPNAFLNRANKE